MVPTSHFTVRSLSSDELEDKDKDKEATKRGCAASGVAKADDARALSECFMCIVNKLIK